MGRMKDVYADLVSGIQSVDVRVAELGVCMAETNNRLDSLLHLMNDMVKMEAKIESLEEKIDGQVKMLLDRVVEMSMIQRGDMEQANVHRAQSRLESGHTSFDNWEKEEKKEDWPPPGCDAVDIRG